MKKFAFIFGIVAVSFLVLNGCSDTDPITGADQVQSISSGPSPLSKSSTTISSNTPEDTGVLTANGWYEEEEIYYILSGIEEGVTRRGQNELYIIGGDRKYQANVALFIPGEPGYSPHWNVNVVNTADGKTLADILASPYVSAHYPEALFDDAADIVAAESAGLVTIAQPGIVVLCPVISEQGAEAPGNTELSEDFPPFPNTF
jgi:hypothetical protein